MLTNADYVHAAEDRGRIPACAWAFRQLRAGDVSQAFAINAAHDAGTAGFFALGTMMLALLLAGVTGHAPGGSWFLGVAFLMVVPGTFVLTTFAIEEPLRLRALRRTHVIDDVPLADARASHWVARHFLITWLVAAIVSATALWLFVK